MLKKPKEGSKITKMLREVIERIEATEDHFEILNVSRDASTSDISKAYKKLALKLHPDKTTEAGAEDAFKKVSGAFSVLKDTEQRTHYEKYGNDVNQYRNVDPDDLFREFFQANTRQGGFHFQSNQTSFTFNSFSDALPPALRPLFNLLPTNLIVLLVLFGLYWFLSPILTHLYLFILTAFLVPRGLRTNAYVVCLLYSFYDSWFKK